MDDKFKFILDESARLFLKYGIRNLSMDDICRELAISKKTLYQYVANKHELIRKILDSYLLEYHEVTESLIREGKNAIDLLLEVSKFLSIHVQHIKPQIHFELEKYYPDIHRNFKEKKRKIVYHYVKKNIENGIKEGLYRNDLDIDLTAKFYMQKIEAVHDHEFINSVECSFSRIFQVMFENHIRGIANEKGIRYYEKVKETLNFNF